MAGVNKHDQKFNEKNIVKPIHLLDKMRKILYADYDANAKYHLTTKTEKAQRKEF